MGCSIIERARKYIAECPVAVSGQRGHDATFHVAALLVHGFALSESDALRVLQEWNRSCQPPWSEPELLHKVKSAGSAQHDRPRGHLLGDGFSGEGEERRERTTARCQAPVKAAFAPAVLKRIAKNASGIKDIMAFISERSPVVVETQDSASVLRRLYRRGSGERVIIFTEMKSQGQFIWEADKSDVIQNRHLPTGENGVWLLPQPVTGEFYPNPRLGGKRSRRSEEAITSWRYAILESDEADADDWLRCLVQVPLRIACICESGGRSIHSLVRLDAESKADWDRRIHSIKPILITLGADAGALSAVRLSRLPEATRGARCQRLLYLNPGADVRPIMEQPTREALYVRNCTAKELPSE
jgi:hypothetical protein